MNYCYVKYNYFLQGDREGQWAHGLRPARPLPDPGCWPWTGAHPVSLPQLPHVSNSSTKCIEFIKVKWVMFVISVWISTMLTLRLAKRLVYRWAFLPWSVGSGSWSIVLCTGKVAGSFPGQGTHPGNGFHPRSGAYRRQLTNVSLPFSLPF